ncbi:cleavage and polyadenylation specificity factor subunit 6-like [Pteropus medius]|uniref:cleavage and polyadenylation specificity factor subunit 6-like n=1 Tax=Pteropus vampyrus TaxID=132908 RepID=UPI00196A31EA|nr:cleavage and polyadenylation specificity factor subunit 6-like [Pteropus giganteus]
MPRAQPRTVLGDRWPPPPGGGQDAPRGWRAEHQGDESRDDDDDDDRDALLGPSPAPRTPPPLLGNGFRKEEPPPPTLSSEQRHGVEGQTPANPVNPVNPAPPASLLRPQHLPTQRHRPEPSAGVAPGAVCSCVAMATSHAGKQAGSRSPVPVPRACPPCRPHHSRLPLSDAPHTRSVTLPHSACCHSRVPSWEDRRPPGCLGVLRAACAPGLSPAGCRAVFHGRARGFSQPMETCHVIRPLHGDSGVWDATGRYRYSQQPGVRQLTQGQAAGGRSTRGTSLSHTGERSPTPAARDEPRRRDAERGGRR